MAYASIVTRNTIEATVLPLGVFSWLRTKKRLLKLNIEGLDPAPDPPDIHYPVAAQISFNSLAGHLAPETLYLLGTIVGHQVVILMDGSSTQNFIQGDLVSQLGFPTQETRPL